MRDKIQKSHHEGRYTLPDDQCEHVSLDFVIGLLLDRETAKRERSSAPKKIVDPG